MPELTQATTQPKDGAKLNSIQSSGYQQTSTNANTLDSVIQARGYTTNQDLINYFIKDLGHGDFNAGAVAAQQYGYNLNELCQNRDGKISGVTAHVPTTGSNGALQSPSKTGNDVQPESDSENGYRLGQGSTPVEQSVCKELSGLRTSSGAVLTKGGIAGIMGNMHAESGMNPGMINGVSDRGLCSWRNGRRDALLNDASKAGVDWTNIAFQVGFLLKELENGSYDELLRVLTDPSHKDDPEYCAGAFTKYYERPHSIDETTKKTQAYVVTGDGLTLSTNRYAYNPIDGRYYIDFAKRTTQAVRYFGLMTGDMPPENIIPSTKNNTENVPTSTVTKPENTTETVTAKTPAKEDNPSSNAADITYTVCQNDTLSTIAEKFKVSGGFQTLADYNHIENPDVIHVGQIIKIPASASSTGATNEQKEASKNKQENQGGGNPGSGTNNSEHCTSGEKVVKYAEQYIGLPYVWGAKGQIIDNNLLGQGSYLRTTYGDDYGSRYDEILKNYYGQRGFDCSGLCCACYKDAVGLDISEGYGWRPKADKAIWTGNGKTEMSQLKIGDVIESPGHYVMYYGNGKAIESCGSKGVTNTLSWDRNGVTAVYRYYDD